ncbi:MAG: ComEC family competence protein [Bacteroidia bacterium]|nr:ComEC family competence protein [Bacteroidia bacterium]
MLPWQYPFLWAASGLSVGLMCASVSPIWGALLLATTLLLSSILYLQIGRARIVWILPTFAFVGYMRGMIDRRPPPNPIEKWKGYLVLLRGYTTESPLPAKKTYRVLLNADSLYIYLAQQWISVTGRCIVYVRDSIAADLPIGSRIGVSMWLDSLKYGQKYWQSQGIAVGGFAQTIEHRGIEPTYWMGHIMRLRSRIVQAMEASFPEKGAALALTQALLLGYKHGLDKETREAFRLSGAVHILAVSGMHVGMVLSLWLFVLRYLVPPGRWAYRSRGILLPLLFFYGFLTGASPSAMRAVIMGSIATLAYLLYKPYKAVNALGFAAFLQLSWEPQLLYHPGFQLSYAAVGGILVFYPPLAQLSGEKARKSPLLRYFRDLLAVSLAAQGGTCFLSWAHFERFPVYFLLSNLLAIPLATALAFLAVGWLLLLPLPGLGSWAAWPVYGVSSLLLEAVRLVAQLPGASLELPPLPLWIGVLATIALLGGGGFFLRKEGKRPEEGWII